MIMVGQPAASTVTGSYTGPPVPIPDDDVEGVQVPMRVNRVGPVSSLTFSVDGTNCKANLDRQVGLSHTFVSDLLGTLTAPGVSGSNGARKVGRPVIASAPCGVPW